MLSESSTGQPPCRKGDQDTLRPICAVAFLERHLQQLTRSGGDGYITTEGCYCSWHSILVACPNRGAAKLDTLETIAATIVEINLNFRNGNRRCSVIIDRESKWVCLQYTVARIAGSRSVHGHSGKGQVRCDGLRAVLCSGDGLVGDRPGACITRSDSIGGCAIYKSTDRDRLLFPGKSRWFYYPNCKRRG